MGWSETIVFYLLFGAGVAVAVVLRDEQLSRSERAFRTLTALLFWPLFVPLILHPLPSRRLPNVAGDRSAAPPDALAVAIAQAELELDSAIQSLDGWAENILAAEQDRFAELRSAWRSQADRIRQLDKILDQPGFTTTVDPESLAAGPNVAAANETRFRQCEHMRLEYLRRLRDVRAQMQDELVRTLAWVRELVTMIHLARFTGAPVSRAEELVTQIAAAVAGLSEVNGWRTDADAVVVEDGSEATCV